MTILENLTDDDNSGKFVRASRDRLRTPVAALRLSCFVCAICTENHDWKILTDDVRIWCVYLETHLLTVSLLGGNTCIAKNSSEAHTPQAPLHL